MRLSGVASICFLAACTSVAITPEQEPASAEMAKIRVQSSLVLVDVRVGRKVLNHVLVNLLLEINAERPVGPDDLIGAHTCMLRNVSIRVWHSHIRAIVADGMVRSFDRCSD